AWAWRRLRASGGRARVSDLADELGWTRRHLNRKFHEQIGLSPKTAARVLRFEHVVELVDKGSGSLGEIAANAGYSDHAHLGREVRDFAGCPPGELARALATRITVEPAVMSHLFKDVVAGRP
ncbi:MAG TPA: helix-turn-helix domain-containing protein, partial [Stackebrandtia sp.]|uniref:helix-turn-helix domain-containing protein n=1 Tax=Stackebrandtia sp. TaxID=2023065 RepID=UPI002D2D4C42